jgi:AcrR family transcriptional regulator
MKDRALPPRADADDLDGRIVAAAIALAEEKGEWTRVRMHEVAERLGVAPAAVLARFPDLDGIADAWLRQGLAAMIADKPPGFGEMPEARRLEACIMAFLDALAGHREATAQMVRGKLHPTHLHHWVPMIFNLSRTIHWLREAARMPAPYGTRRAESEEIALTGIFVATFWVWSGDDSPGQERTRDFLRRQLR